MRKILLVLTASTVLLAQSYYTEPKEINTKDGYYWSDKKKEQVENEEDVPAVSGKNKKKTRSEKEVLLSIEKNILLQNAIMIKILENLDYNFPRKTPKYTKNTKTGEKCITNSSADCFVMPLMPEAQQVPPMANFIRNPSTETAKVWLKWFATYQNHLSDIGFANTFTYKQYGQEVYPTNSSPLTALPKGGASDARKNIKTATVQSLNDKIEVLLFIDNDNSLSGLVNSVLLLSSKKGALAKLKKFKIVMKSEKQYAELYKDFMENSSEREKKIFQNTIFIKDESLFKKYNISFSPTAVAIVDVDNKKIWQKVAYSNSSSDITNGIYDFLVYNRVVEPQNINDKAAFKMHNAKMNGNDYSLNTKDFNATISKSGSKIKVDNTQIIEEK